MRERVRVLEWADEVDKVAAKIELFLFKILSIILFLFSSINLVVNQFLLY